MRARLSEYDARVVGSGAHRLRAAILPPPAGPSAVVRSAKGLASRRFETEHARGLFAGVAAHSMMPLTAKITAAAGLVLAMMAHAFGWPLARGGSQRIADALGSHLRTLGGQIATSYPVSSIARLPPSGGVLPAPPPRPVLLVAADRLPAPYR